MHFEDTRMNRGKSLPTYVKSSMKTQRVDGGVKPSIEKQNQSTPQKRKSPVNTELPFNPEGRLWQAIPGMIQPRLSSTNSRRKDTEVMSVSLNRLQGAKRLETKNGA